MDKKNFSECEIIQDLLPLYYDDVCTPASKDLVQRHLEHCAACRALYEELGDRSVDRVIETESRQVLERHARKERTAAWKAGLIISVLLLVPVILTFLFSIAVGEGLGVASGVSSGRAGSTLSIGGGVAAPVSAACSSEAGAFSSHAGGTTAPLLTCASSRSSRARMASSERSSSGLHSLMAAISSSTRVWAVRPMRESASCSTVRL